MGAVALADALKYNSTLTHLECVVALIYMANMMITSHTAKAYHHHHHICSSHHPPNGCIIYDLSPSFLYNIILLVSVFVMISPYLLLRCDCSLTANNISNEGAHDLVETLKYNSTLIELRYVYFILFYFIVSLLAIKIAT